MAALSPEVARVAGTLVERIVGGAYPAGLRLPAETELAAELGVGRSTLREALTHLGGLGLVSSRRGSGVLVRDYRKDGTLALLPYYLAAGRFDRPIPVILGELLHMRTLLACEAVRVAATYATLADLAPARDALVRVAQAKDAHALTVAEMELYRALVHASGVWPAVWMANAFWEPVRAVQAELAPTLGVVPRGYAKRLSEVLDHIAARDAEKATKLVREHFRKVDAEMLAEARRSLASEKRKAAS